MDIRFQEAINTIPAIAEPIKPYEGINIRQIIILKNVLVRIIFLNTCCLPVIYKNWPTEPAKTLNSCPIIVINKAAAPVTNSAPKRPSNHSLKMIMPAKIGMDEKKIILAVCAVYFLKPCRSPLACNWAKRGAETLLIDMSTNAEKVAIFKTTE